MPVGTLEQALTLHQAGRLDEAVALYLATLSSDAQNPDALHLLGMAEHQQGRHEEAAHRIRQAIAVRPQEPLFQNNLGVVLLACGRTDEAEAAYRLALIRDPKYAAALNNLGNILRTKWQLEEAAECYRRALETQPDFCEAIHNLGSIFADQRKPLEAIQHFRNAIALRPDYADAWKNLGVMLLEEGEIDEAGGAFAKAIALRPNDAGLKLRAAFALPVIPMSVDNIRERRAQLSTEIDRLMREPLRIEDPIRDTCGPVFHLAYHGLNDRELQARIAGLYLKATPSLNFTAPHCRPSAIAMKSRDAKVHVGILSRFLHQHSIGDHYAGLIRNLPQRNARYTVLRFPGPFDAVTRSIEHSVDRLITLSPQLVEAREQIAQLQLDVLFYTDIGMDPWTYFLAFARLAPVQCVTLGQPVTSGIPNVDYVVSFDKIETPQSESHYTERIVRLDHMPHYFPRPAPGDSTKARGDFGLPDGPTLYVCPQALFKIHPEFEAILGEILRRDERGLVVLFEAERPHWTRLLTARLKRSLGELFNRVRFLPRQSFDDFLRVLELADVLLDTIHFSGGTTTLQALAIGTPLVTLPGEFARGRGTYSLFAQIGVLDTVARNAGDYVRLAVEIANTPPLRTELRAKVRNAAGVIFDNPAAAIEFEQLFVDVAQKQRRETGPEKLMMEQGAA